MHTLSHGAHRYKNFVLYLNITAPKMEYFMAHGQSKKVRTEIHQILQLQFPLLGQFFIEKVPVKDLDIRVSRLGNLDPWLFAFAIGEVYKDVTK
jgi:hypothetical protein